MTFIPNASIVRFNLESHFTQIPNETLNDERLSDAARGLLVRVLSKPADWQIRVYQLANSYSGNKRGEGIEGTRAKIKELIELGYCVYEKHRNEKGQWLHKYTFYPYPYERIKIMFPQRVEPDMVIPPQVKPNLNKERVTKKESTNITTLYPKQQLTTTPGLVPAAPLVPPADCVVPAALKKKGEGISEGERESLKKDDIYFCNLKFSKGWSPEEIEYAWKELEKNKSTVLKPIAWIEGVINKQRDIKKSRQEKKCPTRTISEKKETSPIIKKEYSAIGMSEPMLARFSALMNKRSELYYNSSRNQKTS